MSGFEVVASVILAFFVIGIGVGALLVIALPALQRRRYDRAIDEDGEYRPRPGYGDYGPGWQEPPSSDDDDTQPRWPGGTSA